LTQIAFGTALCENVAIGEEGAPELRCGLANRAQDWLAQSQRDLEQAISSQAEGRYEWACFAAQQSAEKAVKALHLSLGQEAWGHMISRLLQELPVDVAKDLISKGMVLDNFYAPTRYANGHPEGAPFEHYGNIQSNEAIRYAGEILEFARAQMAGPGAGGPGRAPLDQD